MFQEFKGFLKEAGMCFGYLSVLLLFIGLTLPLFLWVFEKGLIPYARWMLK